CARSGVYYGTYAMDYW
nr:immunoglobulin heavy chain junction region [Mus musculus]